MPKDISKVPELNVTFPIFISLTSRGVCIKTFSEWVRHLS
jgi:hypothetical protein